MDDDINKFIADGIRYSLLYGSVGLQYLGNFYIIDLGKWIMFDQVKFSAKNLAVQWMGENQSL